MSPFLTAWRTACYVFARTYDACVGQEGQPKASCEEAAQIRAGQQLIARGRDEMVRKAEIYRGRA